MEVASVGRSLANEVHAVLKEKYADEPWVSKLDALDEIVGAACLAHDLGNPPFGHSGEKAISTFFSEGPGNVLKSKMTERQWADLTNFEGNANSLRLLTHQFNGRRPGGFAMTYSMLASIVKYPYESRLAGGKSKFGFFESEVETFQRIADELGLLKKYGKNLSLIHILRTRNIVSFNPDGADVGGLTSVKTHTLVKDATTHGFTLNIMVVALHERSLFITLLFGK